MDQNRKQILIKAQLQFLRNSIQPMTNVAVALLSSIVFDDELHFPRHSKHLDIRGNVFSFKRDDSQNKCPVCVSKPTYDSPQMVLRAGLYSRGA